MRLPILGIVAVLTAAGTADAKCPEPRSNPDPFFSLQRAEAVKKFPTLPAAEQLEIALLDVKIHERPHGYAGSFLVQRKEEAIAVAHERALCSATSDVERLELSMMIGVVADFFPAACSAATVRQLKSVLGAEKSADWRDQMARYASESNCKAIRQAFKPRKPVPACASPSDHDKSVAQANNVHMLLALYLATGGKSATPVVGGDCRITWLSDADRAGVRP